MKTRAELIEVMAIPIHEGNCCTSWEQALKSAEAALNALLRELPKTHGDLTAKEIYEMTIEEVMSRKTGDVYYKQLLSMRKD